MLSLADILAAERIKRETEANQAAAQQRELDDIVAGIHGAWLAAVDGGAVVKLQGDYGKAIEVDLRNALRPKGIEQPLPGRHKAECLSLKVERPDNGAAICALEHVKTYPYQSELIAGYPGHTPPEEMVRTLLVELAKHVHKESL